MKRNLHFKDEMKIVQNIFEIQKSEKGFYLDVELFLNTFLMLKINK